ncbi:MAG TPA: outer membrane lipid asymmetry maintenance protein MlaD [Alphaproteobacteria bacterium]|nr:outer membrane lipid asymmetry maintenance protein MlaD [Alphaproteobacteria bacterium]
MKKNPIETVLGILVILVAGLFVYYAEQRLSVRPQQGYTLTATFLKSGGLESGNDVRINGIKVGSVTGIELTPDYTARISIDVKKSVSLPADSVAAVVSDGLMGGIFLQLEPGKSADMLKDGDTIKQTRDFKSLESMIGDVIFLATGKEDE